MQKFFTRCFILIFFLVFNSSSLADKEERKVEDYSTNIVNITSDTKLADVKKFPNGEGDLFVSAGSDLSGNFTLYGNLQLNEGASLSPGSSVGMVNVNGDVKLSTVITDTTSPKIKVGADLNIEVNGPDSEEKGKGADHLSLSGKATLTGINLNLLKETGGSNPFVKYPSGEKWSIISTLKGVEGEFLAVTHNELSQSADGLEDFRYRVFDYGKDKIEVMAYDINKLGAIDKSSQELQAMAELFKLHGANASSNNGSGNIVLANVYDDVVESNSLFTIKETQKFIENLYPVNLKTFADAANRSSERLKDVLSRRHFNKTHKRVLLDESSSGDTPNVTSVNRWGLYADGNIVAFDNERNANKIKRLHVGGDFTLNNNVSFGVGFAHAEDDIVYNLTDYNGKSSNNVNETKGFVNLRLAYDDNIYLSAYGSYGKSDYVLSRGWNDAYISSAATLKDAKANTKGGLVSFGAQLGYMIEHDNGFNFDVYCGTDYHNFSGDDYKETGDLNNVIFSVSSLKRENVFFDLGLRARYLIAKGSIQFIPEVDFKVQEMIYTVKDAVQLDYIGNSKKSGAIVFDAKDNYSKYAKYVFNSQLTARFNENFSAYAGLEADFYSYKDYFTRLSFGLTVEV